MNSLKNVILNQFIESTVQKLRFDLKSVFIKTWQRKKMVFLICCLALIKTSDRNTEISVASGPMTKNPEIIAEAQTGSLRAYSRGPCAYTKTNKTKEKQTYTIPFDISIIKKKSVEFMPKETAYPFFSNSSIGVVASP